VQQHWGSVSLFAPSAALCGRRESLRDLPAFLKLIHQRYKTAGVRHNLTFKPQEANDIVVVLVLVLVLA